MLINHIINLQQVSSGRFAKKNKLKEEVSFDYFTCEIPNIGKTFGLLN